MTKIYSKKNVRILDREYYDYDGGYDDHSDDNDDDDDAAADDDSDDDVH